MEIATTAICRELFGKIEDKEVYLFTFTNKSGNKISIANYGGIITSWNVVGRHGIQRDVVLGFNDLESYQKSHPYIGVIAGRYANRIAHGRFQLDDKVYQVNCNEAPHHLHGGYKGFDKVLWDARIEDETLVLGYRSKDGEEGFPGNLDVTVSFNYSDDDALTIVYKARTDQATPVNLTSHSYFNLTGDSSNTVQEHVLSINADHYIPVNEKGIPDGSILPVKDSAFDFSTARNILSKDGFMNYDHNYALNNFDGKLRPVALLAEPNNGLQLEVMTTQPGMQLYTGIHLDSSLQNRTGTNIQQYSGVCLETQHFPDSPNHPHFPNTILRPGETYNAITVYKMNVVAG